MDWAHIAEKTADLLKNQHGLYVPFSWNNRTYHGCRTNLRKEDVNTDEGLIVGDYKFSLLCPSAQFQNGLPEPRMDIISIEGETMRVLAWERDAVNACVRIDLGGITA